MKSLLLRNYVPLCLTLVLFLSLPSCGGEDSNPLLLNANLKVESGEYEGCSPGRIKNYEASESYQLWRGAKIVGGDGHEHYLPDMLLIEVFSSVDNYDEIENETLIDALGFGGGPGVLGGAKILSKQAVAALVNATNDLINYPLTGQEVLDLVNDAYDSFDRSTMIDLAGDLDTYNNLGCPEIPKC